MADMAALTFSLVAHSFEHIMAGPTFSITGVSLGVHFSSNSFFLAASVIFAITAKKDIPKDARAYWDETGKFDKYFSAKPGEGD